MSLQQQEIEMAEDQGGVPATGRPTETQPRILIVGVGDLERCDDGVGVIIARALRSKNFVNTSIVESSGDGALLSQLWRDADRVYMIDASSSGARPATIRRIDARARTLPIEILHSSTHTFGVAEAIELARELNQLPSRLIVYAIEGKSFEPGLGLSPEIIDAARHVVSSVTREVKSYRRRGPRAPTQVGIRVAAS